MVKKSITEQLSIFAISSISCSFGKDPLLIWVVKELEPFTVLTTAVRFVPLSAHIRFMFSAKVTLIPPLQILIRDFLNFSLDNSQKKNYNKNMKFGIYELAIRNRPLGKAVLRS